MLQSLQDEGAGHAASPRIVVRHRGLVLPSWVRALRARGVGHDVAWFASVHRFSVPGSDSGFNILRDRFHERTDGAFTLVAESTGRKLNVAAVDAATQRGAAALPDGADRAANPTSVIAPALLSAGRARQVGVLDPKARIAQIRAVGFSDSGTQPAVDLDGRSHDQLLPVAAGIPLDRAAAQSCVHEPVVGRGDLRRARLVLPAWTRAGSAGAQDLAANRGMDPELPVRGAVCLSMHYEVFLLSRMREGWDRTHDNEHAVAYGLEQTGRIITAAAIIMIAAFSGFPTGRIVGLQEFGIGLSAAILLDATVVRALLVPATMNLLGRLKRYLPEPVRRAMRLRTPGASVQAPAAGR
jgi:MMPL family